MRRPNVGLIFISTLFSFLLLNCAGKKPSPSQNSLTLRIKGSDTMLLLVQRWNAEFMKLNSEISVYAEGGGSRTGIKALIEGNIDIAAASRPWQPGETRDLFEKQGSLGISILCARDALSLYLHPDNPVINLDSEQIKLIFSGQITNWKDVGGLDEPIIVLNRNPNSGTYLFFAEHILLGETYTTEAKTLPTTNAIVDFVKENRGAIGYGGMTYGMEVYHCKIDGVEPTPQNVRNGKYPISRYLYLYTTRPPQNLIKKYVDWVLSPLGQKVVAQVGFIPLYEIKKLI